jgi:uncharacterized OsmC-like protein
MSPESVSSLMTFELQASRLNEQGSLVRAKETSLVIDTSAKGRTDALNPVELLLAALAACLLKGIERVAEPLALDYKGVRVELVAHRKTDEALVSDISYRVLVDTQADQSKLDLLHKNLIKFGTIYNTIKAGTELTGTVVAGA